MIVQPRSESRSRILPRGDHVLRGFKDERHRIDNTCVEVEFAGKWFCKLKLYE